MDESVKPAARLKMPRKSFFSALNPARWSPECWSTAYVKNRIESAWYQRKHPEAPWLTQDAVSFLRDYLKSTDRIAEFGSGRSTRFFSDRCDSVLSFEHDAEWHCSVQASLEAEGRTNVVYRLRQDTAYYEEISSEADASFDAVLVDGVFRADAALQALPKLRPGGVMIIDNVNRHIPNKSRGPGSIRAFDQNDPEHQKWIKYWDITSSWRRYWTTNGVFDTLFQFAPFTETA
jgi:predicted O-methyltransferase YrrM